MATSTPYALLSTLLISTFLTPSAWANSEPQSSPEASSYAVVFERGEEVPGLDAPAIVLPFQCVEDGTVYFNQPKAPDASAPFTPILELSSVSPSREVHTFVLGHIPDLFDVQERDFYASDSHVVFLVKAARENKQAMKTLKAPDGTEAHGSENNADHHPYILVFDRQGKYDDAVEVDDAFAITKVSEFPSGSFLAYGYERSGHSPKLAMLKDDGKLIKFLEMPAGAAPQSAFIQAPSDQGTSTTHIAAVQFVRSGADIVVVQNKTDFPLLEVSEAGTVRAIRPQLPQGVQIDTLIPSDGNLYARVKESGAGPIYELNPQDGTVLGRFEIADGRQAANIACVHERKFLSFDSGHGKLIQQFGNLEPSSASAKPSTSSRP